MDNPNAIESGHFTWNGLEFTVRLMFDHTPVEYDVDVETERRFLDGRWYHVGVLVSLTGFSGCCEAGLWGVAFGEVAEGDNITLERIIGDVHMTVEEDGVSRSYTLVQLLAVESLGLARAHRAELNALPL